MRSHEQEYEPYECRAVIVVDPSGGVVHESGIDPEIDRERCGTRIDERTSGAAWEREENRMDAGGDQTKDTGGQMDRGGGRERK